MILSLFHSVCLLCWGLPFLSSLPLPSSHSFLPSASRTCISQPTLAMMQRQKAATANGKNFESVNWLSSSHSGTSFQRQLRPLKEKEEKQHISRWAQNRRRKLREDRIALRGRNRRCRSWSEHHHERDGRQDFPFHIQLEWGSRQIRSAQRGERRFPKLKEEVESGGRQLNNSLRHYHERTMMQRIKQIRKWKQHKKKRAKRKE